MGEIWRAVDTATNAPVAIKRMPLQQIEHADVFGARLMREAAALQQLEHLNIVRYLGAGLDDQGRPYLALEWLEGEDLSQRQRRSSLTLHQVLDVVRQALAGLAFCHQQNMVHRDIKPANLFLVHTEQGPLVKLLDLGLVLLNDDSTRLTQAGTLLGTLSYLSPEQARGLENIDHRADIYAMGVILYELVTSRLPFSARQPVAVLLKIITETPPRPRELCPDLPVELEQVILRAMQREPADRFATADQMLAALPAERDLARRATEPTIVGHFNAPAARLDEVDPGGAIERRLVALLCVQAAAQESEIFTATSRAVEEVGSVVQRLRDGQMVGIFGLDRTQGDEALRAVRAGLAVSAALGSQARILAATVHVELGEGVQLDTEELDRTLAAVGDLPPGELILDRPTRQLVADQVQIVGLGEHYAARELKTVPLARRRVLGVQTSMVGRESEAAAVRACFDRAAQSSEPEAVVVIGPAGIGKSRLLQELLPELRQRSVLCLEAHADSTRSTTPYSLLSGALRREAGIHVGQDQPTRRQALADLVRRYESGTKLRNAVLFMGEAAGIPFPETTALRVARSDPKVMRQQVAMAFEDLCLAAGEQGALTLVLEDLHWADEESLRLCEHLLDRLDTTPLFVLATCRPEALERHAGLFSTVDATRVELATLGRRPLRKLLRQILGDRVPADVEALIARQCAGNPFFAEELVSWMVSGGVLAHKETGWEVQGDPAALELPASVEGAIQGRLDRLEPELKALIKAASVFGQVLWEGGCVALGFPRAAEQLCELEAQEFVTARQKSRITEARRWVFGHALLQQVAYQMLPEQKRGQLHLRAGQWLETMGEHDAAMLARHFKLGGAQDRAARYFALAGERALADGDLKLAVEFYEESLSQEAPAGQIAEWTLGLARAYYMLGQNEQSWAAIEQLRFTIQQSASPRHEAESRLLMGRILFVTTRYSEAEALLSQATELLTLESDAEQIFEIKHTLFWVIWVQGNYQDAGNMAKELYQMALGESRRDQLCMAKLAQAYCNAVTGDLSIAVQLAGEAVTHAREIGHPYREVDSLMLLGSSEDLAGLYERAQQTLATAHALATRLQTVRHLANIETRQARICSLLGQIPQSLAHYRSAGQRAGQIGDKRSQALALVGEARTLCQRGKWQDLSLAERTAQRGLDLVVQRVPPAEAEARMALAEISLARERVDQAVAHALAAVELLDQLGTQEENEIEILLVAHDALAAAGRMDEALVLLQRTWQALSARTSRISDRQILRSFMEQVPHNLRVKQLWQEQQQV